MLVTIKPIKKEKWHGLSGDKSIARDDTFTALVDSNTMQYAVDMSEEEIKEYSKKLNTDLSLHFTLGKPHPFWDSKTATVTLKDIPVVFDTKNPLEYVKYKICKGSSIVANSLDDYNNGLFPRATHYIYTEEEETEIKTSKIKMKRAATKAVMSASRILKDSLCLLVGGRITKDLSGDAIEIVTDELIEAKAKEVVDFFKEAKDDKNKVLTKSLVEEALYYNVLKRKKGGIYYFETSLGFDLDETTEFLMKDINQTLKLQIMKSLNK